MHTAKPAASSDPNLRPLTGLPEQTPGMCGTRVTGKTTAARRSDGELTGEGGMGLRRRGRAQ